MLSHCFCFNESLATHSIICIIGRTRSSGFVGTGAHPQVPLLHCSNRHSFKDRDRNKGITNLVGASWGFGLMTFFCRHPTNRVQTAHAQFIAGTQKQLRMRNMEFCIYSIIIVFTASQTTLHNVYSYACRLVQRVYLTIQHDTIQHYSHQVGDCLTISYSILAKISCNFLYSN